MQASGTCLKTEPTNMPGKTTKLNDFGTLNRRPSPSKIITVSCAQRLATRTRASESVWASFETAPGQTTPASAPFFLRLPLRQTAPATAPAHERRPTARVLEGMITFFPSGLPSLCRGAHCRNSRPASSVAPGTRALPATVGGTREGMAHPPPS